MENLTKWETTFTVHKYPKIPHPVARVKCIRDSREMEEYETLCIQLGLENFRGLLEKRLKQNTLQHIYHYQVIFLIKTVRNFSRLSIFKF